MKTLGDELDKERSQRLRNEKRLNELDEIVNRLIVSYLVTGKVSSSSSASRVSRTSPDAFLRETVQLANTLSSLVASSSSRGWRKGSWLVFLRSDGRKRKLDVRAPGLFCLRRRKET